MSEHRKEIHIRLNGEPHSISVGTHESLVEVLHTRFGLTGARESCSQGLCGCCTVMVNGQPVSGCLYLAVFADGADIGTIEAAAPDGEPDLVQQAFIDAGAFQCGFCTPGFVLMTRALLREHPSPEDDQIRHYLAGNLCRCAAYPEIIAAVKLAASRQAAATAS
jgi:carbon-monoxide dehydrogenase small subunit